MAGWLNREHNAITTELPSVIGVITVRLLVRTPLQKNVTFIKSRCHTAYPLRVSQRVTPRDN
jgi:hypothetical protein